MTGVQTCALPILYSGKDFKAPEFNPDRKNDIAKLPIKNKKVTLTGLSLGGIIMLPIRKEKKTPRNKKEELARKRLIQAAKNGDEDAIESLTIEDIDTYNELSNRVMKEDILIWVSINVTNCSDGVDGLCGTLSVVTLASAYILFKAFNIESAYRHTVLIMVVCILGYLWFNASPSKLLMGDAGSRAIGIFIAFTFLKLHAPLLYIPMALVIILYGGLGLIKVSFMRFLHINLMKNLRTPIHDHMRKNKDWSDTQVVFRYTIVQIILGLAVIYGLMF